MKAGSFLAWDVMIFFCPWVLEKLISVVQIAESLFWFLLHSLGGSDRALPDLSMSLNTYAESVGLRSRNWQAGIKH